MTTTRRCIGSARFGIEAHDADPDDFPVQPSQKDGLGRMCKPHWRQYTNALRKAAVARKAETPEPEVVETPDEAHEPEAPAPRKTRRAPRPSRRSTPRSSHTATRRAPGASPGPASQDTTGRVSGPSRWPGGAHGRYMARRRESPDVRA